jgi:hypothetical protein
LAGHKEGGRFAGADGIYAAHGKLRFMGTIFSYLLFTSRTTFIHLFVCFSMAS